MEPSTRQLDQAFLDKLSGDGFSQIGTFEIADRRFNLRIEMAGASNWLSSVYAWVGVGSGGTVLRIGKCVGRLETRLTAYKRSLNDAMSDRLQPNEHFKGDTQPWERELWLHHVGYQSAGRIFALTVEPATLRAVEAALIKRYDPLMCGDSAAGRRRRREWIAEHGPTVAISKRARLAAAMER